MIEETNKSIKQSDIDALAYYEVITDAYTQRYKFRTWMFKKVLKHMLSKVKDEPTIYFLMETVKENR